MSTFNHNAAPRLPYRAALVAAVLIAAAVLTILAQRDAIERALGQPAAATAPCRLAPGQVAHIPVHERDGQLVARCHIAQGRST